MVQDSESGFIIQLGQQYRVIIRTVYMGYYINYDIL